MIFVYVVHLSLIIVDHTTYIYSGTNITQDLIAWGMWCNPCFIELYM